jgi:cytochrome c556
MSVVRTCQLAALTSVILIGGLASTGLGQQRKTLPELMKQKLDQSQKVLAGLTQEDFDAVARSAQALRRISEDAQWRISPNTTYVRLTNEFQALTDELGQKAKERNLDGATVAYVKLTINCIACHKLVRDERLVRLEPCDESHTWLVQRSPSPLPGTRSPQGERPQRQL